MLASCGGSDEERPTAQTATIGERSSSPPAPGKDTDCREAVTKGLKLVDSFNNESRGIVAPDTERYRADGRKIIRDARRAGCPVPESVERQMEQFLGI